MKTFEDYLKSIHSTNYMGTDDDMLEHYENWLSNLSNEELIDLVNIYTLLFKEELQTKGNMPQ